MQSLLLIYDIYHNKVYLPHIHAITNNTVQYHFTRSNCNLHIPQLSTVDKHNFVYYAVLNTGMHVCMMLKYYPNINFINIAKLCICK